jgi:hypothetical protein
VQWHGLQNIKRSNREIKIVKNILQDTLLFYCYEEEYFEDYLALFHFIDLDGDKDLDLIFNGRICGGHESESIYVFMKKDGQYKLIVTESGKVLNIEKNKEILFYQYPCCASISNFFRNYKISKDTLVSDYTVLFYSVSFWPSESEFAYKMKKSNSIKLTQNTLLYMYTTKESNHILYSEENNNIGKINDEIEVFTYFNYMDEHDNKWSFVLIDVKYIDFIDDRLNGLKPNYIMLWVPDEQTKK